MPTTDLKFFTNEPERTLYDRFNKGEFDEHTNKTNFGR